MNGLWWQLRGPSEFLRSIHHALTNGRNVVLFLPAFAPDGLQAALQEHLRIGHRNLEDCTLAPSSQEDVAVQLIRKYLPGTDPELRWNANTLVQSDDFVDRIFWVDVSDKGQWQSWSSFIQTYAQACRERHEYERSVFIIAVHGVEPPLRPLEDVFLSQFVWRSCVDYFDILLFTAALTNYHNQSALEYQLRCALIAGLAVWDATLVDLLAPLSVEELLEPDFVLLDVARARGWDQLPPSAFAWEQGAINSLRNDHECVHSAIMALDAGARTIDERIWRAQVSVLFPHIENQRRRFLAELGSQLRVPWQRPRGAIVACLEDLEIGDIAAQLNEERVQTNGEQTSYIKKLTWARNNLAHLKPLDAVDIEAVLSS